MPRLDVLLLPGRFGGEQPTDDADCTSTARMCDSTDVRLHVEFGVKEDFQVMDDRRCIHLLSSMTWTCLVQSGLILINFSTEESLLRFVEETNHITSVLFVLI